MRTVRSHEEIGLFLAPQFPLSALVPLIEVFRIANQTAGKRLFNWHFVTEDGGPVECGAHNHIHSGAAGVGPRASLPARHGTCAQEAVPQLPLDPRHRA